MAATTEAASLAHRQLPEPVSGLFLEISFRRLLASCEDIVEGSSTARPDLYVETLQEQLADLEASAGSRFPRQLLEQYTTHVDALSRQLHKPDLPAFCSAAAAHPLPAGAAAPAGPGMQQQQQQQQQQPAGAGQLGGAAGAAAAGGPGTAAATGAGRGVGGAAGMLPLPPRPAVVPPPVQVARTPSVQPPPAAGTKAEPGATAAAAGGRAGPQLPRHVQPSSGAVQSDRLQTQQDLHGDLTEELAGMAAQLKSSTLAIEGKLKEREQLLDSTETALDKSVQRTRESKERATQIHRRGRANFCLTCLVMLIVGLTFAAMMVFIKLTRFAGYRAAVPAAAVQPAAPNPDAAAVPVLPDELLDYEQHYDL